MQPFSYDQMNSNLYLWHRYWSTELSLMNLLVLSRTVLARTGESNLSGQRRSCYIWRGCPSSWIYKHGFYKHTSVVTMSNLLAAQDFICMSPLWTNIAWETSGVCDKIGNQGFEWALIHSSIILSHHLVWKHDLISYFPLILCLPTINL